MRAFLPFHYAARNLMRDPTRTAQTLFGTALVVVLVMGAHSLNDGMKRSLRAAGPRVQRDAHGGPEAKRAWNEAK